MLVDSEEVIRLIRETNPYEDTADKNTLIQKVMSLGEKNLSFKEIKDRLASQYNHAAEFSNSSTMSCLISSILEDEYADLHSALKSLSDEEINSIIDDYRDEPFGDDEEICVDGKIVYLVKEDALDMVPIEEYLSTGSVHLANLKGEPDEGMEYEWLVAEPVNEGEVDGEWRFAIEVGYSDGSAETERVGIEPELEEFLTARIHRFYKDNHPRIPSENGWSIPEFFAHDDDDLISER